MIMCSSISSSTNWKPAQNSRVLQSRLQKNLGYPPLNSATSLQPLYLLAKTLKNSATSPQQLRNIATSQHRNKQASSCWLQASSETPDSRHVATEIYPLEPPIS